MLDDLFELIVFIFDDIIDFLRIGWKEKKAKKNGRKKPTKNKEKPTENDLYNTGDALWMITNISSIFRFI